MDNKILATEDATQLEVAIRQLEVAIRLFFLEEDPFAIYSLTRNSEEIISRLLKKKGYDSIWTDMLDKQVKPEYREELRLIADNPRNELKHLRKDEGGIVSLPMVLIEHFLLVAENALHVHWHDLWLKSEDCMVYMLWDRTHNPDVYLEKVEVREEDKQLSKKEFYISKIELTREIQVRKGITPKKYNKLHTNPSDTFQG